MTNQVGTTIYEQLGGGKFAMMTGAKHFVAMPDGLAFTLPGKNFCKNSINKVVVKLNPSDTYIVGFYRLRAGVATEVSKHSDIDCDTLRELFERETGLRTSL